MLKILWITSTPFPKPSIKLGFRAPFTGGWLFGLAEELANSPDICIKVATSYKGQELEYVELDHIGFYFVPADKPHIYQVELESLWKKICKEFQPDIVHIHGTEYTPALACMRSNPSLNYVVSIQGLISVYSRYYNGGITNWEIIKNITLRDFLKWNTLFNAQRSMAKRGLFEKEYLMKSNHAIGRTQWDYAHVKAINPTINYHFCNESLRNNFYSAQKWDVITKKNFVIFLSQASYPLKGLHQVIKAVSSLKSEFPSIKIRIAGISIIRNKTLMGKLKIGGYGAYLLSLIHKYNLSKNIEFSGPLDESQMIAEYQNAHVFICPSSIENSPNSVGEAQLIGVPVIGSYVGGTPTMIEHEKTGLLYRFEEIEMLAQCIKKIFNSDPLANELSLNEISAAERRHDRKENFHKTREIYKKVTLGNLTKLQ